jgi:endo-1,4-beta-xylanase
VLAGIGAAISQTGPDVSATNRPWNATIDPGGSVGFGLLGTVTGANPAPGQFTVNGIACG